MEEDLVDWIKGIQDFFGLKHKESGRYYVYGLLDPRFDNKPFYIGKGEGDRVYQHEKDTRTLLKRGTPLAMTKMSCKHKRILEIWDSGMNVGYDFYFRTDREGDAYQYESKIIRHYGLERLTNEVYGYSRRVR
jgi:hypothetical protein